jgi:hypothetical protein
VFTVVVALFRALLIPAFKPAAVPVRLVATPDAGVPRAGVVKTGAVSVLLVSVLVDVSVTRFVGVIMSDKFAMFVSYITG